MRGLSITLLLSNTFSLANLEAKSGVTVNETSNDIRVENATTIENAFSRLDTIPSTNAIGKNTTTITRVIDVTESPISSQHLIAASFGVAPFSKCVYMFSITTMESSTRIPTTKVNASKVIKFRL